MIKSLGKASPEEIGMSGENPPQASSGTKTKIPDVPLSFQGLAGANVMNPMAASALDAIVKPKVSGQLVRKASDIIRNSPGGNFVPQALGDVWDIGRGIGSAVSGNQDNFGYKHPGEQDYTNVENPFRGDNVINESRSQQNPFGAAMDVGKSALGAAATMYLPSKVPALLGATGASQNFGYAHPILEYLARHGLSGAITGTAAGIGTEKPTPGSVGATAATYAILEPLIGLLSKGLDKGQVGKNMQKTADKLTSENNPTSLRDIRTEASAKIKERLDPLDQKEANRLLGEYVGQEGTDVITPTDKTPTELLDWQRRLSPKAQGNFIQQLLHSVQKPNAGVRNQVAEVLRGTVSDNLKSMSPDMRLLNALYGKYSSPLGGPVSMIAKGTGLAAGGGILANILKSIL